MDPIDIMRMQQIQTYQKNQKNRKKTIIIIIIVSVIILLIGGGIGLYFAFRSDDNSESFKVNLPNELKNISLPTCTSKTCIKVGEKIVLNQILSSDNISMIIKDNINNFIRDPNIDYIVYTNALPIFTTLADTFKILNYNMKNSNILQEETKYYLIINNTQTKKNYYLYLNNNNCMLKTNGLLDNTVNIQLTTRKIRLNNNTYYIDNTYDPLNNICLLIDINGLPYSTIKQSDLDKLEIIYTILDTIGFILITNYSVLVFDNNLVCIGVISSV
jgi:hypothetical protein